MPKIVCLFYKEVNFSLVNVMKNVDVLRFGPWFAVATSPRLFNNLFLFISSSKYLFSTPLTKPKIDEGSNDF